MRKLVVNVLAYNSEYSTSTQIAAKCDMSVMECYLKNAFVCLKSCISNTPDLDAALFVNFNVDEKYRRLYEENGLKIIELPFDKYVHPKEFKWALVNYRICCLDYAVHNLDYDYYLALDTDVYCVDDLSDMFAEMKYGVMMHNIGHRLSHKDRQEIIDTTPLYFGERVDIVHFGGECLGGTRENLTEFIAKWEDVFNKTYDAVIEKKIYKFNDEYISSMVAHTLPVTQAVPYMFRYWTIKDFFLICNNWKYNSVCLWHLPVEKKRGIYKLFNYFNKHGEFPSVNKAAAMMGFGRTTRPFVLSDYPIRARNFLDRTFKKKNK